MTSWSVRAFAKLSGVTVKALHHYERRGLLAPRRSSAGYRRYTLHDLERLERILAMKSLGFPLGQIGALLKGDLKPLSGQRAQLAAMRGRIDRAIASLDAVARDPEP